MKTIRVPNALIAIDTATVLLVIAVAVVPLTLIRLVLGVPLLIFFPGYALLSALVPEKKSSDVIERIVLSGALSIAVVALIGLGLNYTTWGIRLWPGLLATAGFVLVTSAVAAVRQRRHLALTTELNLRLPNWRPVGIGGAVSVVLMAAALASVGALGYVWARFPAKETFTEFYILGLTGKAQDYPTQFLMRDGRTTEVRYGTGIQQPGDWGKVTVVIVNREQEATTYSLAVTVDGQAASIYYAGDTVSRVGNIRLASGGRWQETIGIAPLRPGNNQEVEFQLFKDGAVPAGSLHIWITAVPMAGS